MDLLDLFLNQRGESERIRRLSRQIARKSGRKKAARKSGKVEDDLGTLALALLTVIKLLEEKGVISAEEFQSRLAGLDRLDGVRDGKIDAGTLRRALGLGAGPAQVPVASGVRQQRPSAKKRVLEARQASRAARDSKPRKARKPAQSKPRPAPPARRESKTASFGGAKAPPPPAPEEIEVPEMPSMPDAGGLDPSKLGEISYEDYFGQGQSG
jgi:hypothetical protein